MTLEPCLPNIGGLIHRPNNNNNLISTKSEKYIPTEPPFPSPFKVAVEKSNSIQTPFDWLADKRKADNVGEYWRVHDKLYDLSKFVNKHPGGRDWIEVTRGTDITEAFESSHVLNVDKVESILSKYYVSDITVPRNSPYTFKDDGFYKTLKRRVEPLLKEVGTGPTRKILLTQDGLALGYIIMSHLGAAHSSIVLQIIAGILLGMCVVGSHNFLHIKNNWRKYYFDLSPMSHFEWLHTHALSHHLFPNTNLDYEVAALEPFLILLPNRPKTRMQRYGSLIYSHLLYTQFMGQDILKRLYMLYMGKAKLRPENLLILIQLATFTYFAPNLIRGFLCWFLIYSSASYYLAMVGLNAAHHHEACYHEGDEFRNSDPDFGLCQLDATIDKADEVLKTDFAVLTSFGQHPSHHLFPSVCHSKLYLIKPIFEKTLEEFLEKNRYASQLELFLGTHRQYARTEPWSHEAQRTFQFNNAMS